MADEKPKIIVDEDWKSQVEAEKSAAKTGDANTGEPVTGSADSSSADTASTDPPMPPASFQMLISSLATEAMMALGQMPHPLTGEAMSRRNQAKYLIDTIDMLREKTVGNVSAEETAGVEELLHSLRMVFVKMPKSGGPAPPAGQEPQE